MFNLSEYKQSAMLGGHIVKVLLDPLGEFPKADKQALLDACGLIPAIFSQAAGEPDTEDAQTLYKAAVGVYGCGDYSGTDWGTVSKNGVYTSSYEDDPPLKPIAVFRWPFGVEVLVYRSAIIAVRDEETTIISRMD